MRIYRLEDEGGTGVYMSGRYHDVGLSRLGCITENTPAPDDPGEPFALAGTPFDLWTNYVFCFSSLDQAFAWFTRENMISLLDVGIRLNQYEIPVDRVLLGRCQVAFIRLDTDRPDQVQIQDLTPRHADMRDHPRAKADPERISA